MAQNLKIVIAASPHSGKSVAEAKADMAGDYETIALSKVADMIGKSPEEIRLPGRDPVMGLNWKPEELPAIYNALQEKASAGGRFVVDGRCPQWLALNLMHALHPNAVALADSKVEGGLVGISGHADTVDGGSGPLPFCVSPDFQGGTLVEYAKDGFVILDVDQLNEIAPPTITPGRPVFMSGRTANWAAAEIAMTYAHTSPAVYLYQPGTGFVCAITHSPKHVLGSIIAANP